MLNQKRPLRLYHKYSILSNQKINNKSQLDFYYNNQQKEDSKQQIRQYVKYQDSKFKKMRYLPFILLLCSIHIKCFTQTKLILTNQVSKINLKPMDYMLIRNRGNFEIVMAENDDEIVFKAVNDVDMQIKGIGVVSIYSLIGGNQDTRVIGHCRQRLDQKQGLRCQDGYVGPFCISKYSVTSDFKQISIKEGEQKLLKINSAIILKKWQICLEVTLCQNQHFQNCQQLHPRDTILTKQISKLLKIKNKCLPHLATNMQKQQHRVYVRWSQLEPPSIKKLRPTFIYKYQDNVNMYISFEYGIGVILLILFIGVICKCMSNRGKEII